MTRTLLRQDAYVGLMKLGVNHSDIYELFLHMQNDLEEWKLYESKITARINAGESRINQMGVVDDVRKERGTRRGKYKTNNNWAPMYMRLYAVKYPEHRGKFEFRKFKEAA